MVEVDDPRITAATIKAEYNISHTTLYRLIKEGQFPPGEPVGLKAVRWRRSVVQEAFRKIGEKRGRKLVLEIAQ